MAQVELAFQALAVELTMQAIKDSTARCWIGNGAIVPPDGLQLPALSSRTRHAQAHVSRSNTFRLWLPFWLLGLLTLAACLVLWSTRL